MSPPIEETARTVGERFELQGELGRGGLGVVYLARDLADGKTVAVKLLDPSVRGDAAEAEAIVRFRREAQVLARLDHPGIVHFLAFGETPQGGAYIAMERVEGRSLSSLLEAGPLPSARASAIARDLAAALAYAHEAGVVHRDVKPGNVIVGPTSSDASAASGGDAGGVPPQLGGGSAKLLDFGLAQLEAAGLSGDMAGTYAYMAPEQAGVLDRAVDARVDLYSCGVVLFEMLAGRPPFLAKTLSELLHMHVAKRAPRLRELVKDVPEALEAIVAKLLEKDPDDRYQSARGLLRDLGSLDEIGAALPKKGASALDSGRRLSGLRREPRFVGREPERAAIQRSVESAARGSGKVLLLEGPEGIGKSRLLDFVREATLLREGVFLLGRSERTSGGAPGADARPYQPIIDAVRARLAAVKRVDPAEHARLVGRIGAQLQGWADPLVRALGLGAPVEASTAREQAGASFAADKDPRQERQRLHEGVLRLLLALAPESAPGESPRPVVLALDDVAGADEETVSVLDRLARHPGATAGVSPAIGATAGVSPAIGGAAGVAPAKDGLRLLVVATLCVEGPGALSAATLLLAAEPRPPRLEILRLFPLAPEQARALVTDHLRALGEPTDALVRTLVERAEGSPDAIDKLVRRLVERNGIERGAQGLTLRPGAVDEIREAPRRSETLVERALTLPETLRERLACMACLRRPFGLETAAAATEQASEAALDTLDAGVLSGLLVREAVPPGYRFADEAARRALRALLSREAARPAHERIAGRLAALEDGHIENAPWEVAHHFESADLPGRAVPHLGRAGDLARAVLAFDDARLSYERALALNARSGDPAARTAERAAALLSGLGDALAALGRYEPAREAYRGALEGARSRLDRCRLAVRMGAAAFRSGDGAGAEADLGEALRALHVESAGSRLGRIVQLLRAIGKQALHTLFPRLFRGRGGVAQEADLERIRLFRELERIFYFVDIERATETHLRGLNLAERFAPTRELGLLASSHVVLCGLLGFFARARRFGATALEVAREAGDAALVGEAHLYLGMAAHWAGTYPKALEHFDKVDEALSRRFEPWTTHAARSFRGAVQLRLGQVEAARATFDSLLDSARELRDERGVAVALLGIGEVTLAVRGPDEARPRLEEATAAFGRLGDNLFLCQGLRALARASLLRGRADEAVALAERSRETIERGRLVGADTPETYALLAEALVADAALLASLGRREREARIGRAWKLVKRARRGARRFPGVQPAVERAAALVELSRGRPRQAAALFADVAMRARALGQRGLLGRALADMAAMTRAEDPRRASILAASAQEIFAELGLRRELFAISRQFGESGEDSDERLLGAHHSSASGSSSKALLLAEKRKLEALFEVGKTLHSFRDLDRLLARIVDVAIEVTGAERGFLLLTAPLDGSSPRRPGQALHPVVVRATNAGPDGLAEQGGAVSLESLGLSQTLLRDIAARGEPQIISDASADEALRERRSVAAGGLRSILCVPLKAKDELLGVIYLDNRLVRGLFGAREIELVSAFAVQAALAIENARTIREIETANKRLRETQARLVQSAKMSAIGQLAAGVSHEIRNPLNTIGGSIYLLREHLKSDPSPKVREYLSNIESEIKRAAGLIEDLLEFAKPADSWDVIDLNAVLARSIGLVTKVGEKRGIALACDPGNGTPLVKGSSSQLQQVVVNLVLNAVQSTDEGGRVVVRTSGGLEGREARIEVSDTGHGIKSEDIERIFEPFFTRREGGTGLGLYITYSIIERHGGRIECASEVGKGTTFTIVLPAVERVV